MKETLLLLLLAAAAIVVAEDVKHSCYDDDNDDDDVTWLERDFWLWKHVYAWRQQKWRASTKFFKNKKHYFFITKLNCLLDLIWARICFHSFSFCVCFESIFVWKVSFQRFVFLLICCCCFAFATGSCCCFFLYIFGMVFRFLCVSFVIFLKYFLLFIDKRLRLVFEFSWKIVLKLN